ncbi:MAG TPA: hypothetical protein VFD84_14385 [Candidatus Binatia bacterium]|nr:hypothetical protein [Candidatus Binatia bacterium]
MLVVSALPAEIEPLLAAARLREAVSLGDRTAWVGTLGDAPAVLVRGGIGLVNAAATVARVRDRFPLAGVVLAGVAGSDLEIGDVAVPVAWSDGTTTTAVAPALVAIAEQVARRPVRLDRCTHVPPEPPGRRVCLGRRPRIVVGGVGVSADPFGGAAFPCRPGGGPVFGCDEFFRGVGRPAAAASARAEDMETAAVARAAAAAGVPFIGFRGVSDGGGDPLGLPGFPAQFFAYYRLSADNAAAAALAFLRRGTAAGVFPRARRAPASAPRAGAACDWERVASAACAGARAPRAVTAGVARACAALAAGARAVPGSDAARAAAARARARWRDAAAALAGAPLAPLGATCRAGLAAALAARAAGS